MKSDKIHLPHFERIRRELEERIRNGTFCCGASLPSEQELAGFFNVGRNTVRRAIKLLEKDGWLCKHQGKVSQINRAEAIVQMPRGPRKVAYFSNYLSTQINSNVVYFDLFNQFVAAAAERGWAVDFFSTDAPDCWNTFIRNRPCYLGAFSAGVHRGNVSRGMFERLESLPELIALDELEELPACHLVAMDNYEGARLAARHLLQCDCRNIVMLGGDNMILPFRRRQAGFEDELQRHSNIRYKFAVFRSSAYEQLQPGSLDELWACVRDADGVFCYCDLLAFHVLAAAHYHNRNVPNELSVIGFDGIAVGRHTCPKLTSVEHPARLIVETALDVAAWLAETPGAEPQKRLFCGKVLPGETTKILRTTRKNELNR